MKQLTLRSSELVEIIVLSFDVYLFTFGFYKAEVNEVVSQCSPGGKCNLEERLGVFFIPTPGIWLFPGLILLSKIRLTG